MSELAPSLSALRSAAEIMPALLMPGLAASAMSRRVRSRPDADWRGLVLGIKGRKNVGVVGMVVAFVHGVGPDPGGLSQTGQGIVCGWFIFESCSARFGSQASRSAHHRACVLAASARPFSSSLLSSAPSWIRPQQLPQSLGRDGGPRMACHPQIRNGQRPAL